MRIYDHDDHDGLRHDDEYTVHDHDDANDDDDDNYEFDDADDANDGFSCASISTGKLRSLRGSLHDLSGSR